MSKRKITKDWYSSEKIDKFNCAYKIIIGERSNGKTYCIKKKIIDRIKNGSQFGYIRRKHKHIVRLKMLELFSDISDYAEQELGDFIKYSTDIGFFYERDGEKICCGQAFDVENAFDFKGVPYPNIDIILFDEFLDYDYMENETQKFLHIISTIVRLRENIDIYLLANTISKYSPYFELFGIEPQKLKQGCISVIHHNSGVTAAVEYCKSLLFNQENLFTKKNKYIGFDGDNTSKMIMFGEWESKNLTCKSIDGISWDNKERELIPLYITGLGKVFELSIIAKNCPIAFVRVVNTQKGKVRKDIKYNLSLDGMELKIGRQFVPQFRKMSSFIDKNTTAIFNLFVECLRVGRCIFSNANDGTEFLTVFNEIIK